MAVRLLSRSRSGPPPVPPSAVLRSRLIEQLEAASRGRLTLLCAPAGSGKSVLLGQWAAVHPDRPTAWVLLEADDDAVAFAHRLVDAFRSIDPRIGQAAMERLETTGLATGRAFLEALLADLTGLPDVVLVLEDVHWLSGEELAADVTSFIERAPANLHVVASTRSELPLTLHRLRVRGEVTELRQEALALEPAETGEIMRRIGGADLDEEQLTRLVQRTEGWVAGVQLTALSLRAGGTGRRMVDIAETDGRVVTDYLTDEIVSRQPEQIRRFLLRTSVLHRLTPALCDVVTADNDGQRMLELLERRGLFLSRLDGSGHWYRFHPLFREVLRNTLASEEPEAEQGLLFRAANWHLGEGDLDGAAAYLIEARAWDELTDLAVRHGRELWLQGKATMAVRWLEAVPEAAQSHRPTVKLTRAALYTTVGRSVAADEILGELEAQPRTTPGERLYVDLMRVSMAQMHLAPERVIQAADRLLAALETPAARDIPDVLGLGRADYVEMAALVSRGRALLYEGQPAEAHEWLSRAVAAAGMSSAHPATHALGTLAMVEALAGRLVKAKALATRALTIAQEADLVAHPTAADALLALGQVERERNDLDLAQHLLDEGADRAAQSRRFMLEAVHRAEAALLQLALGAPDEGLAALVPTGPAGPPLPRGLAARLVAVEARLVAVTTGAGRARAVLASYDLAPTPDLRAASAHVALAARDVATARQVVDDWPEEPALRPRIERTMWDAAVLGAEGRQREAEERMAEAVSLAEPEGHVRVFLDAGDEVVRILRALDRGRPNTYVGSLVAACAAPPALRRTGEGLVEQLSERELMVLRHLPSRLSNAEIAAQLYISVNTLKTHLKHIYWKLGVTTRRDAIAAAEGFGLL